MTSGDGMTMICVTHKNGLRREVADEVIFMVESAIIEVAPQNVFTSNPEPERAKRL